MLIIPRKTKAEYNKQTWKLEKTYSSFVKVRTQSISEITHKLTRESALPTAKCLSQYNEDIYLVMFIILRKMKTETTIRSYAALLANSSAICKTRNNKHKKHTFLLGQLQCNNNPLYEP